jgi:hypothetical protein
MKATTASNIYSHSEPGSKAGTHPLLTGVVTGQIAGLIMAVAVMGVFLIVYGKSPLFPVQVIGSTIFGAAALEGLHIPALLAGLLLHQLGPSLFWGLVFGFCANRMQITGTRSALFLGLAIGVISMVDVYLLVPAVMNALHGADFWNQQVPMFWDWVAHIIFGASFALYPKVSQFVE